MVVSDINFFRFDKCNYRHRPYFNGVESMIWSSIIIWATLAVYCVYAVNSIFHLIYSLCNILFIVVLLLVIVDGCATVFCYTANRMNIIAERIEHSMRTYTTINERAVRERGIHNENCENVSEPNTEVLYNTWYRYNISNSFLPYYKLNLLQMRKSESMWQQSKMFEAWIRLQYWRCVFLDLCICVSISVVSISVLSVCL